MADDAPTTRREDLQPRVEVLLEALPYIRQFAGATIVIKYGGAAMTSPELKASFARDVALLKLVGMNPVVVHGGGPDISRYSDRLGLEVRFERGLRVTDAPTMELVKMVLVGKVNKEIVAQLHVAGAPAVGLAGDDGGLILADKAPGGEADLGFVGRVKAIDPRVLERLSDFVPVVASVGVDESGQSYNINADTVAGRLAAALGARKAIFLTDVEGVYRDFVDPASLISECRLGDLRALVDAGAVGTGMIPKLAAVIDALEHGVGAAHIIDGRVPHSVLVEIFTETGIGTKVTA
ncbi:acetylglutamate kinase [Miltoncostaea marina]|uniref:acetylglutamate kinase n=1 Tax=Miltoncostaea marina TaxID=2843215 RepID=UPI001C3E868F|nr:acetylglutamate kinase [Miltoncostaea marina]